jgi:hypothetical protein
MLLKHWTTPEIGTMSAAEARIISALRLWVVMNKLGRPPMQPVAERLGSARAAAHLHLLIEEIGAAWPEPFCVSPPCCSRLSHDEATLGAMVAIAGGGDRRGFDRLLEDLLPAEVRERLFLSSSILARNAAAAAG